MCDDGNEYATQLTYKITIRNAKNTRITPFVVRVNNKCGRRRRPESSNTPRDKRL
ncbi:MAG: hypothetical protein M3136_11535 [Thermoproteota archaeon]|nr:hypothetical protein [Thermoproteota archaeon]